MDILQIFLSKYDQEDKVFESGFLIHLATQQGYWFESLKEVSNNFPSLELQTPKGILFLYDCDFRAKFWRVLFVCWPTMIRLWIRFLTISVNTPSLSRILPSALGSETWTPVGYMQPESFSEKVKLRPRCVRTCNTAPHPRERIMTMCILLKFKLRHK